MIIISDLEKDPLSKQILDLLIENGIRYEEMDTVLSNISKDIEILLWNKVPISLPLLYHLKDVVWFNLEHLPSGGEERGRSTLKWMGSKFPHFIFLDSLFITKDKLEPLINELEQIRNQWSNEWYLVSINSKTNDWSGGMENPSEVIIYEPNVEKPSRYGYNPYGSSGLLDIHGKQINTDRETVLCAIESKLGSYGKEPLMKNLIETLITACKKAVNFEKGILLDVNSYNYY